MSKIRVLHILDELNTGGAEQVVFSYLQNIDKKKYQWDFIIMNIPGKPDGRLEEKVRKLGCNVYKVTKKRDNLIKNIIEVDKIISLGHYDIVHSHLYEVSAFYLLSAKIHKVPVRIAHNHSSNQTRGIKVDLLRHILKPILKYVANAYVACGIDAATSLWGNRLYESGKVKIIYNAIDTTKFQYKDDVRRQIKSKLKIDGCKVIGTVGRFSIEKNSAFNIEIFKEIHKRDSRTRLVIVGEGELKNEIEYKIKEYSLENSVMLLGRRNDVYDLLNCFDVFLLPSLSEGLPIVLVEAQCNGLPCVVSDSVTKEVAFSNNVRYLSLKSSAIEWADNVIEMFNYREIDSKIAKDRVISNGYDIVDAANELDNFYTELLFR